MVTRAKAGIFKPLEHMNCHVTTTSPLHRSRVHALPNVNAVRSMWLFKHKFNANSSLSRSDIAYLLLYVDDIILTTSSSAFLQRIIASLHNEFAMKDLGSLKYFLSNSTQQSTSGLFLSQSKFAEEILDDPTLYHSLVGALQYLTFTRPDLFYAVQKVCLYMHDPRDLHFTALKRIFCYVRGSLDYGLQLHVSSTTSLVHILMLIGLAGLLLIGPHPAEYRGVANVVAEIAWIRNLLCELHTPLFTATLVYCDNVSAIYMSVNPVQHQRTKHIEIDIHFIRDFVASGEVHVIHVPSRFQYADIFTKGLPTALLIEFRASLNVRRSPAHTEGE
nr:ribonuclease H-like domain-containing protein [Tanacetum cinerariifolium]